MAEERRKGPSDRRRTRGAKADKPEAPASAGNPDEQPSSSPNDSPSHVDALDESIRTRQEEGRGEVF